MGSVRLVVLATLGVAVIPVQRSWAGPDWVEDNDAGQSPPSAQKPTGTGSMSTISGSLAAVNVAAGPGDFVDMYQIYIADPAGFSAQTIQLTPGSPPGFAAFDSQLWLFDHNGFGILANDDAVVGQTGSRIAPPATDATNQVIPGPGVYYLAISAFDADPLSGTGELIFSQEARTEVSGPDGPGGSLTVRNWGTSPQGGMYLIGMTGVKFPPDLVPAVSTWGMAILFCATAIAGTLCLRRRATAAPDAA